jgi:ribonuclease P protein component
VAFVFTRDCGFLAKYTVIKQNYEFRRAYRRGKSFVSPCLVVYCFKKKYGGIKIGITSSKKIGKAVVRNRARRVIREAFRSMYPEVSGNWDIIFVARTATARKKSTDVAVVMRKQLREAGVLH